MITVAERWRATTWSVPVLPWAIGAGAGVAVGALAGELTWLAVGVVVGLSAAAAGWFDLRFRRLPNRLVLATLAGALGAVLVAVLSGAASAGLGFVAGGLVAAIPLLVVHLINPRGLGFGDVKYAGAIGACVGVVDWRLAVGTVLVASLAGPLLALGVRSWRRSIPYGLLLGFAAIGALGLEAASR